MERNAIGNNTTHRGGPLVGDATADDNFDAILMERKTCNSANAKRGWKWSGGRNRWATISVRKGRSKVSPRCRSIGNGNNARGRFTDTWDMSRTIDPGELPGLARSDDHRVLWNRMKMASSDVWKPHDIVAGRRATVGLWAVKIAAIGAESDPYAAASRPPAHVRPNRR